MATGFQRKSFSFSWRIANFDFYMQYGAYHCSPWFTVDTLRGSRWRIGMLQDMDDAVGLRLESDVLCYTSEITELNYCFTLSSDCFPSSPVQVSSSYTFRRGSASPWMHVPKATLFKKRASKFVLPDTLTIQCRMWKMNGSLAEDGECTAVTDLEVERVSFGGTVTHFRGLMPYEKHTMDVRSASNESLPFHMHVRMDDEGTIYIALTPLRYEDMRVCKCLLYLLDVAGNEVKCGESEFVYHGGKPDEEWTVPLRFSKGNLLALGEKCLPNDSLSVQCEVAFCTAKVSGKIVKTKYATRLFPGDCSWVAKNHSEVAGEEEPHAVKDDLLSLLSTGVLSDVRLQTATRSFQAHKSILGARSLEFRSLFTSTPMKDCVRIDDLDADTVGHLLRFLYSDCLPNLDLERAKKLHFAAVKYGVAALRGACRRFLEEGLCPTTCCDVLVLAHEHCDSDLKKAAQNYIARHDKDVLRTCKWINLEETHPSLIIETFHVIYQRNRRNV